MSIVVDSSVLIAALIDTGSNGIWAEGIISCDSLYAPELVRVEVVNVLRRLERSKLISAAEANVARDDFLQLDIILFPFKPSSDRIWELRHNLTSFDAWYVAVAEALELPLATLDEALSGSTGAECEFLVPER